MPDTHTRTQHGLAQCPMCAYKYRDPIREDLLAACDAALSYVIAMGDLREGTEAMQLQRKLFAAIRKARGEE